MGIADTTRAKAQAAVSRAEADVTEIQTELKRAQSQLEGSGAARELLDSVADVAVIGPLTDGLRDEIGVDKAQLKAEVDRLTAELSAAQDKLNLALKTQAAVIAVIGADHADR